MTVVTKYTLDENQYITDLKIDINIKHQLTHLEAPTGRGKTTFIIEALAKKLKIIMVCPVKVQVAQLEHDFRDNPKVQCITGKEGSNAIYGDIVICVYDKLKGLLDSGRYFSTYMLVVDEAHKMYQAASYRRNAISVLLDAINDGSFKQVLTVSATFQPDIFPFEFDEQIVIDHQHEHQPDIDVIYYKKKLLMDEGLLTITPSEGKVAIIRINNKKHIELAKIGFELRGFKVLVIYSDIQKSQAVIDFLETSLISGYDIVLTTSLLDEAINIKNKNIESVHIFHKLHCDEIKQFVGRCRKSVPKVHLHLLNSELNYSEVSFKAERERVERLCETSLDFCNQLANGRNDFSKTVRQINETVKFHHNFSPLYYDYQESEVPSIDEVSILAKLYSLSMEEQYKTDQTLGQSLVDLKCFNNIELIDSGIQETDKTIDSLVEQATVSQLAEREKAIDECVNEISELNNDEEKLSVDDVSFLADKYEQSGVKGDITSDWKALCFILPVEQALDAVRKDRKQAVWNFYTAIEYRLELIPFFVAIKEDLKHMEKLEFVGSDTVNQYFLNAIRVASKKQEGFKDFIKKMNINAIKVKDNNQFKICNRFLFKFIKEFTLLGEEPKRTGGVQSFTIIGIGPFGYDYNINSLRSSKNKPRVRRRTGA
jgi:hypothetical protein